MARARATAERGWLLSRLGHRCRLRSLCDVMRIRACSDPLLVAPRWVSASCQSSTGMPATRSRTSAGHSFRVLPSLQLSRIESLRQARRYSWPDKGRGETRLRSVLLAKRSAAASRAGTRTRHLPFQKMGPSRDFQRSRSSVRKPSASSSLKIHIAAQPAAAHRIGRLGGGSGLDSEKMNGPSSSTS